MIRSFWIFIFCFSLSPLRAQQYSLHQFGAVEGLPQSQVSAMIEDKNGYLWIGTDGGGLARFDGKNFKVYTTLDGLLSNMIISLMMDSHENLWVLHSRGISKFDGSTFKKFQAPTMLNNKGRMRRLYEIKDTIYFLSNPGVLGKIHNDSVLYWYQPVVKNKLMFFGTRTIKRDVYFYLSDSSFLIRSQSGKQWRVSHKDHFQRVSNLFNYRSELIVDSDKGLFRFSKDKTSFEKLELPAKNHIVAFDSASSAFWTRSGEYILRESNARIDTVLKDILVTQILFDREGNTWIGTSGRGLYKYSIRDFNRCASEKLGAVMAIHVDRGGATWLGTTEMGLWKIKKGNIKRYSLPDSRAASFTDIAQSPSGNIWAASFRGLGRYDSLNDDFNWYTREHGLSSQYVTCIDFDDKGSLWGGTTDGGVISYNGNKFTAYPSGTDQSNIAVYSIHYMKKFKKLFIGMEWGVAVLNNGKMESIDLPELINSSIFSINTYQDSLLLIGSSGSGVIIYDPVKGKRKVISSREGLRSNLIYFVAADRDNYIWVGTEQGIHRLALNRDLDVVQNRHFGFNNGLTGVEANHNAYYLGKNKYFGVIDGVYQFNDYGVESIPSNNLHITSIDIFYGEVSAKSYAKTSSDFFKIPSELTLPPDKNHITFTFSRVDKRDPESVRYKYFLENFDKTWSLPATVGQITYGNLPPGNYIFNLVSTNKSGSWDEKPLTYAFTVEAPFYQKAYFIFFCFVFIAGSTILYFYWKVRTRVKKMLEIERIRQFEQANLRKEIARDFHDEMGNQLTRIINYISLMKISKNGHATELYNKVEESAKYLYTGTRDFIWSIDPVNDELSKLFIHIRDFGEKIFEEKGIQFRAYNHVKDQVKVPYGFCREANLIFKEAMTNAFNHSNARNVSFILNKTDRGFEMVLDDDGEGFNFDRLNQSNGLRNMRSRAERIKSTLRIVGNREAGGTIISLIWEQPKTAKYDIAI